ncbi:hypothetical protein GCM10011574_54450 [Microbispora bryophytorum]|uniref:Uncharacterized protein n=1 Tax=Microbispora bryophytorum TaxID=1460882 RepID=A0A8H9LDD6_9ACTN|nr:hypothetical protein GCM10011574_54450 [Microbispora bryophytorum]
MGGGDRRRREPWIGEVPLDVLLDGQQQGPAARFGRHGRSRLDAVGEQRGDQVHEHGAEPDGVGRRVRRRVGGQGGEEAPQQPAEVPARGQGRGREPFGLMPREREQGAGEDHQEPTRGLTLARHPSAGPGGVTQHQLGRPQLRNPLVLRHDGPPAEAEHELEQFRVGPADHPRGAEPLAAGDHMRGDLDRAQVRRRDAAGEPHGVVAGGPHRRHHPRYVVEPAAEPLVRGQIVGAHHHVHRSSPLEDPRTSQGAGVTRDAANLIRPAETLRGGNRGGAMEATGPRPGSSPAKHARLTPGGFLFDLAERGRCAMGAAATAKIGRNRQNQPAGS